MTDAVRVLVVEDSATTSQIVAMTLRGAGYDAVTARLAAEAQAHLKRFVPRLVIVDQHLPDAGGLSLCRFLRGDAAFAPTKIILVSGLPRAEFADQGFPGAYDAFLEKPFSLRRLLELVRSVMPGDYVHAR